MRLLIAGGGTGGHVFPGIAVADEFKRRHPDGEVVFVGTERGLETTLVPAHGYRLELINVSGLKTVGLWAKIKGVFRLPGALWQSWRLLRRVKPDVVLGVGGYASGPVVLMARMTRRPTAILEQNSMPGLANKWLGKFVHAVFLAFQETRRFFRERKIHMTGNPVRADIAAHFANAEARAPHNPAHVLIIGGSQGAVAVNELVVAAAKLLGERGVAVDIHHQAGKKNYDAVLGAYSQAGVPATVLPFIDDMAKEYAWADLVIGRAGATSVAELAVAGCPAILIPYPHAADDHQAINAKEFADAGAAIVMRQTDTTAPQLAEAIAALLNEPARLQAMQTAMRKIAKPHAATAIVEWFEDRMRR